MEMSHRSLEIFITLIAHLGTKVLNRSVGEQRNKLNCEIDQSVEIKFLHLDPPYPKIAWIKFFLAIVQTHQFALTHPNLQCNPLSVHLDRLHLKVDT